MTNIEAHGNVIARHAIGAATATAHANIALIKYWGKADERLIIPTTSSLSITLDGLSTRTMVEFLDGEENSNDRSHADTLVIDGVEREGSALERVSRFLDIVRARAGIHAPARVTSGNTVPFGAGLASSASAFAALAAAASCAAGLDLSDRDISRLARRGSGSACRSVYGGLVQWNAGHDDASSYAVPVPSKLDLAVVVIAVSLGEKALSSRLGMRRTVATSPLYPAWVESSARDLQDALDAVAHGDLQKLGEVSEANALGMHATMLAARPAILYWQPGSVAALHAVETLRAQGLPAWSTMDAGPNVKVLTDTTHADRVADALRERLPECSIHVHRAGPGVHVERRVLQTS